MTGTALVRLTMAPNYRVQGIVRGAAREGERRGTIVGDSHPDGMTRGLVQLPGELTQVSLGPGAILQMMRTLATGAVNQGVVEVPNGSIPEALMGYFQSSEQIASVVQVSSTFDEAGQLIAAGAYLVQLLPEVSRAPLAVMTERLAADFSDIDQVLATIERDPTELLAEILSDMPYEQTQETSLHFGCVCSSIRVLASLATLPKDDIRDLMSSDEHLHITCDYCNKTYELPPKSLEGLLTTS